MEQGPDRDLSLTERESRLWTASKQYMLGDIDVSQLERAEDLYSPPSETVQRASSMNRWTVVVIGCLLLTILFTFIILWHYRELLAFLVVGLVTLAILVMLMLRVIQTVTDAAVRLHEQKLRRERENDRSRPY